MHVHASDRQLTEPKSAKFFVRADGSSVLKRRGDLTKEQQKGIQAYIKKNYLSMYEMWSTIMSLTRLGETPSDGSNFVVCGNLGLRRFTRRSAFSSDKVEIEFDTPVDGKVKFTATPKETDAKSFFMKVKMLP